MQPLLDYIRQCVDLDYQSIKTITAKSREVRFPKGHLLLKEGAISKSAYFIVKGRARSYYIDANGKTVTWFFHFNEPFSNAKNLFINDYRSFLTDMPGTLTVEALTPVTLIQWSMEDYQYLLEKVPVFEKLMRKLNEQFFIVMYDRIFSLLMMTGPERYHKLLKEESHLHQMFSNYYLSSYLALAPQSLSRIKKYRPKDIFV